MGRPKLHVDAPLTSISQLYVMARDENGKLLVDRKATAELWRSEDDDA
jgi:hypothetical protein